MMNKRETRIQGENFNCYRIDYAVIQEYADVSAVFNSPGEKSLFSFILLLEGDISWLSSLQAMTIPSLSRSHVYLRSLLLLSSSIILIIWTKSRLITGTESIFSEFFYYVYTL